MDSLIYDTPSPSSAGSGDGAVFNDHESMDSLIDDSGSLSAMESDDDVEASFNYQEIAGSLIYAGVDEPKVKDSYMAEQSHPTAGTLEMWFSNVSKPAVAYYECPVHEGKDRYVPLYFRKPSQEELEDRVSYFQRETNDEAMYCWNPYVAHDWISRNEEEEDGAKVEYCVFMEARGPRKLKMAYPVDGSDDVAVWRGDIEDEEIEDDGFEHQRSTGRLTERIRAEIAFSRRGILSAYTIYSAKQHVSPGWRLRNIY